MDLSKTQFASFWLILGKLNLNGKTINGLKGKMEADFDKLLFFTMKWSYEQINYIINYE